MNDREWEQWNRDLERIAKDDTQRVRFYEIAKSAKPPLSEHEIDQILKRWKLYGKTMFGTATQAELFVKDAIDQVVASSSARRSN